MRAEFKEKTYEKYFGHELARLTNVTFSPDQVDEGILGFDEAFLLPEYWLWRLAPYVRRGRRHRFFGVPPVEFDRIFGELSSHLPPFRFNLFVQYKRPEYIRSRSSTEWENWRKPYYRYDVTPHQQAILEKIETQSHNRAATVYASPAFWTSNDLFRHAQAQAVTSNSNIVSVGRLNGHGRYTYAQAGFQGKAHSEATDIESQAISTIVANGLENRGSPLGQNLKEIAKLILTTVQSADTFLSVFQDALVAIQSVELPEDSVAGAIATIEAFSDAFGVSYWAFGK
ncbi:MAG TPA: hypothetical protein PLR41_01480 [Alphaproteobacteria bacterium]|nr:hypothetical protein [Alphaproteobacteria bacterium]